MKQLYFVVQWMFVLLATSLLTGQRALPTVSADALAYGKYADIPVNGYTGTADITVPLHTISDGPLSLPVFLQYHTAGQLVAAPASAVGLGWNLNAGGIISRTVRGLPDDTKNGYYHKGASIVYPTDPNDEVWQWDSEPDIFTYSFGSHVGKFFIDANQKVQTVPKSDIKVEVFEPYHDIDNHAFQYIFITTPDGVKYKFGQSPNQTSVAYDYAAYRKHINPTIDRTAWHLVEIESPDLKHRINIEYYDGIGYTYQTASLCPEEVKYRTGSGGTVKTENACNGSTTEYYNIRTVLPKKITTLSASESIEFTKATREDLVPYSSGVSYSAARLSSMKVQNGATCIRYDLSQTYFKNSSSTSAAKRLKLDGVQRISCDNTLSEPAWKFTYLGSTNSDESLFFPATTDKNIDHWGYYNKVSGGTDNNSLNDITPATTIQLAGTPTTYGSANRISAEFPMFQGMLDRVTYPTGGYIDLDYEANRYRKAGAVRTAFDLVACSSGCAGTSYYDEQNFTMTQAMLDGNGRWALNVQAEPGYGYGQFLGKVEVFTLSGGLKSWTELNSTFTLTGALPHIGYGYDQTPEPLVVGQTYKIRVSYTNAKVSFKIEYDEAQTNQVVGGLRLKQTRVYDGLNAANDIIQRYKYVSKTNASLSSGILYREPKYGYSLNNNSAVFTAYSMTPLTTFAGYHIAYERVVIDKNGIGEEEIIYNFEADPGGEDTYPGKPVNYKVLEGTVKENYTYGQGSSQWLTKSTSTRLPADGYVTFGGSSATGYIFAARTLKVYEGGSAKNVNYHTRYTIRTGVYRVAKTTHVADGITTEVNFTYGSNLLLPTETTISNSNGDIHKTKVVYTGNHYDTGFRSKFIQHNILYIPYKSEEYLNGVLIAGSLTDYRFYTNTGGSPAVTATGKLDVPRPYQQKQLEQTYDASGQLIVNGQYVVTQTISEYQADGLPKYTTNAGWTQRELKYTTSKNLYQELFNGRLMVTYNYDPLGGSQVAEAIANGASTKYTYDKLGRLKTVTDVCQNIVTTYTYHFTTGGTDKNYTEVRVDYPKPSANSALDIVETRTYLDGLGRPIQTVAKNQGPSSSEDIITAQEYDKFGRAYRSYEPYKVVSNAGAYRAPSTSWGYTQTTYETTPASRVTAVTPPSWSATTYSYGTNNSTDAVKNLAGSGNYAASLLSKTIVVDGNGNKLITFTDKLGRKVLSRRTNSSDATSARLDTYYLYDGKGRLSKVVPPGATVTSSNLTYTYLYDGKDQVIEKTVPGAQKEEFKYNSRQLLVASRDGKLRAANKWYVHTYDGFGRELKAGLFTGTLPTDLSTVTPSEVLSETGYGTNLYDWNKVTLSKTKVLGTASDYLVTNSMYTSCGLLKEQTGNNHLLISPNNGELTTYAYDGGGNVINSVYTHKVPSQTHTVTSANFYDHVGRPTSSDFKVDNGTNRKVHQLVYDQKNNVITKYQGGTGLSGALAYLQKVDYSYLPNGLLQGVNINSSTGKLSGSQVGLPASGTAATMPSPATPSSTNYDDRDLLYLELYRSTQATGIPTATFPARRNGDIVAVASQVRGRRQQVWAVSYDDYDRMRQTTFYQRDSRTSTPSVYANYNEDIDGYDVRGNITDLARDDNYLSAGKWSTALIDKLEYTYEPAANRLQNVYDYNPTDAGYSGGGTGNYQYDENGNVKYDPSRRITLVYNHLNVPERITWTDGRKLEMTYDAAGTLLKRKTVAANGTTVEERHYVGGIEYLKSGSSYVLESVHHAEGRILFTGTAQEWQYVLTDHLGNSRLVYTDRNGNGIVEIPSEIVQEEHYFPFGMKMTGPWMGGAAGAKTKYQYNGIEYLDAFALNVNIAHYRTLDPTIGRWWGVDPEAEVQMGLSPYNAMNNSPLVFNDPQGDIAPLVALGLIAGTGGILNLGSAALSGKVNSVGAALGYFTTGAVGAATAVTNPGAGYALTVAGNLTTDALSGNLPEAGDSGLSKGLYAGSLLLSGFNATGAVSIVGAISPITLQAARVAFSSSYIQIVSEAGKALAYVGPKDAVYEALKAATGGGAKTVVNASALEKIANSTYITSKGVSTGLTHAGRAVTKHPEIFGYKNAELLRQVYRTDAALNELGLKGIQNILQNGRFGLEFAQKAGGYSLAFRLPNGAGARWSLTGEWIGFVKP